MVLIAVVDEGISVHLFSCDLLSAGHWAGEPDTRSLPSRGLVWSGMDTNAAIAAITYSRGGGNCCAGRATAPSVLVTGSLALQSLC